ncbi:MAG TPA: PEP/pyruvate-binding domain-containing protein [Thermomicrobiales bacterium]|nr:PEP/pyruvate-binding domain-containing protein [Thermomicrobiales bacterium]
MTIDTIGPKSIIRWLDGSPGSVDELGGKGASLNRLRALGAPVSRACAIPTMVYRQFAETHHIPLFLGAPGSVDAGDVRAVLLHAPFSAESGAALIQAGQVFARRDGHARGGVAVRSSAPAEDSADHAFAGLYDSILNVDPACGLEMAVRQCWASLWSDRAVAYRYEQALQDSPMEMAVVIQEMVFTDVAFVAFAADPISGDRDTVLITATWGLCEAVVAGLVVPDEIRVDRRGQLVDYRIGDKHQMVIPTGDGVRCVPVPRLLRSQPAISPEVARDIATMIRALSVGLGFLADVEGGIEHGAIQVFQARPITTLPAPSFHHVSAFPQEAHRHAESRGHSTG